MTPRQASMGRLCSALVATLAAGLALASPAVAMSGGGGTLSARLAALAKPSLRSATPAAQARALSLSAEGPGSLQRAGDRVFAEVRFDGRVDPRLHDLRASGAKVVDVSRGYQAATVAVTPAELPALSRVPGVQAVTETLAPLVSAVGAAPLAASTPCQEGFGAATSEGDVQLDASRARNEFGVNGVGVRVGILSDSFDRDPTATTNAAADVASGDLPGPGNPCGELTPVNVLADPSLAEDPEPTDEGRAMAQIVHDLAPGAPLSFATAYPSEMAFATNIAKLVSAGAGVIVDDISYFEEPFFQEGPVGVAVSKAVEAGVSYFSAAGNNNLVVGGNDAGSWEAPEFREAAACPHALETAAGTEHCMNFDPEGPPDPTFGITVEAGETLTVDLQWAEPWHGVHTDLDAYLLDASGQPIPAGEELVGSIGDNVGQTQKPVEVFQWENNSGSAREVQLVINHCFGVCNPAASESMMPRLKFALLQNGGGVTRTEYETASPASGDVVGPTIFGHNGAAAAVSVGAIPFTTTSSPEPYSSRGPVTHYFGPAKGATAAAAIEPPEILEKPDLIASDGGADTFFGSCYGGSWRFFGTSAAAPHAAAIAALELQLDPSATPAEVKQAETETARSVGAFGPDDVGAGLVDAAGALGELLGSSPGGGLNTAPAFSPPACPPSAAQTAPAPIVAQPPLAPTHSAPATIFARHPRRLVRTATRSVLVSFRFGSDQEGSFLCAVDRGSLHVCAGKLARRFAIGAHSVRVIAVNEAGEADPTPAVFRFRVAATS